jgi:hypothetical protein
MSFTREHSVLFTAGSISKSESEIETGVAGVYTMFVRV